MTAGIQERVEARLSEGFAGELIGSDHPDYDEARQVWNADIDKRPPIIARPANAADVQLAVRAARSADIPIAVRGGGHAVAGHALAEDGIVIDLPNMNAVQVDPQARTATVEGGALWSDVDAPTQEFGLAVTGGIVSHTGVGGLTLGGGIGHLMRSCGLTIDSLRAVDLVTAEGSMLEVSAESEPELYWGLRGGGGNFGIVTRFTFDLHDMGPTVIAGMIVYPLSEAPKVMRNYRDTIAGAPDELGSILNLRLSPPLPAIPEDVHGTPIVAIVPCWAGNLEAGEEALRPLREFGTPLVDTVAAKPYVDHQQLLDPALAHGNHYYWRSVEFDTLTNDVIDTAIGQAEGITSPLSTVPIFHMGGAVSRVADDATAYGSRAPQHDINMLAAWRPEGNADRERHVSWVRGFSDAMAPFATGTYVNFLNDEGADGVRSAYEGQRWPRLLALKRRWDPDNIFRYNSNIDPADTAR